MLGEPHVCRGINMCKGLGAAKDNACAGQGTCATAKAHTCHADNECRGQGGCGAKPGENNCKGMGECGVPMSTKTWKKARARFEELMAKEGKKVGPRPPRSKVGAPRPPHRGPDEPQAYGVARGGAAAGAFCEQRAS